jgi:YVTN family beta-propeller protein
MSDAIIPGCALGVSVQTLSAWRDQALPAREQEQMRVHIAGCAGCQRRLAQYDAIARALKALPTPEPVGGYGRNPRLLERDPRTILRWLRLRTGPPMSLNALAAVLVVALLAGLFALFGPARNQGPTKPPPIATIAATIDLNSASARATSNDTAPWFLDAVDHRLTQVDPASNRVLASLSIPSDGDVATSADGSLWLALTDSGEVQRLDPHDGHVIETIILEAGLRGGMAVSPGAVWVASGRNNHVWRIDTATNRVAQVLTVGAFPWGLAVSGNSLWVCSRDDSQGLWRIDTTTNQVIANIDVTEQAPGKVPAKCAGVAAAPDGSIWVINHNDSSLEGHLLHVDPTSNTVGTPTNLGLGVASSFAATDDAVWVMSADLVSKNHTYTLLRADARTGVLVGTLALNLEPINVTNLPPGSVVFAGDALWAQSGITDDSGAPLASNRLLRITPTTLG